jgi:hypothetical protein
MAPAWGVSPGAANHARLLAGFENDFAEFFGNLADFEISLKLQ